MQISGVGTKVKVKTLIDKGRVVVACSDSRIGKATYKQLKNNPEVKDLKFDEDTGVLVYCKDGTDDDIANKIISEIEQTKRQSAKYAEVTYEIKYNFS